MAQQTNNRNNPQAGNDPKAKNDPKANLPTRQENIDLYNKLDQKQQARYRTIRANKGGREALKWLTSVTGKMQGPAQPTPESITEEGFMGAGQAYNDMVARFQGQQFNPDFNQEMERARQNIMGQFERRNAQSFGQERQDFETAMANRGIAPGGEQYNRELQALTDRQDRARQEALSSAEQTAYGVQQQGYEQAYKTGMMPYEQWNVLQQPYMTGITAQYQSREAQLQRQFEDAMKRGDRASAERIARMSRSGGGGGGQAGPTLYDRMEAENLSRGYNQGQQPNPWASAASGFAAGVGQGIGQRIAR